VLHTQTLLWNSSVLIMIHEAENIIMSSSQLKTNGPCHWEVQFCNICINHIQSQQFNRTWRWHNLQTTVNTLNGGSWKFAHVTAQSYYLPILSLWYLRTCQPDRHATCVQLNHVQSTANSTIHLYLKTRWSNHHSAISSHSPHQQHWMLTTHQSCSQHQDPSSVVSFAL